MAAWWFPAHDKFFGFGADSLFFFSLGALFALKQVNFVQMARKLADKPFADRLIRLSSASFFLYAAHILWLYPLRDYLLKVLAPTSDAAVILFYFAFIAFHCAAVTALYFLIRRFLPKTTAVLTGGKV